MCSSESTSERRIEQLTKRLTAVESKRKTGLEHQKRQRRNINKRVSRSGMKDTTGSGPCNTTLFLRNRASILVELLASAGFRGKHPSKHHAPWEHEVGAAFGWTSRSPRPFGQIKFTLQKVRYSMRRLCCKRKSNTLGTARRRIGPVAALSSHSDTSNMLQSCT